jgi:hypothetical protein
MYDTTDPRSKLATASGAAASGTGASTYARFYQTEPQETVGGGRTWYARGQNFIVSSSQAEPGAVLERRGQVDEYVLLLPDAGKGATVTAGAETVEVPGRSLVFIPAGDSRVVLPQGGRAFRMLTTRAADLAAKCSNASTYAEANPLIPPLQAWPDPTGGFRIRVYSIDPPAKPGRFGQIWRCTTFMINIFPPVGPRPLNQLSPHHHNDFEQCSLAIDGEFTHHLRWPWTFDIAEWRDDEHEVCASPSIAVIPPKVIHTTAAGAPAGNVLVDIFSPPRVDFSNMEGWVLNADDYPAPKAE